MRHTSGPGALAACAKCPSLLDPEPATLCGGGVSRPEQHETSDWRR
jgi:hypothetical protein